MSNFKRVALISMAALVAVAASAGVRKQPPNALSPATDTSVTLGGSKVTVEYSAPSARGRKVEGGLVPYGRVWRAGADSATTLITDADIKVGDLSVPKGTYTMYVAAEDGNWQLIINKQTGQWGTEYNKDQDLGRTSLKLRKADTPIEKFAIDLKSTGANSATLSLSWGNTVASVPVTLAK